MKQNERMLYSFKALRVDSKISNKILLLEDLRKQINEINERLRRKNTKITENDLNKIKMLSIEFDPLQDIHNSRNVFNLLKEIGGN